MDRLRALELPARGHPRLPPSRRGAGQPRAGPPRPARLVRGLPRREAAHLREPAARDDTAVVPRGFDRVPGSAARVEFAADDPLPAEPGLPGRHNRENAAAATAAARAAGIPDEAIAEALRDLPGRRLTGSSSSPRSGGVRFVNDSKATNTAAARRALASYDVAAARDPRRLEKGRELRRARARAPRSRLPDRRDCGRACGARSTARASRTSAAATSSRRSRPRLPRRSRARSSCSRRPARATTSSATSNSGARTSGGWCRTYPGEARPPGVERPRPRHARPRRLRDGDGLQRDLRVGHDRRGESGLLPEAAGDLRRASGSGCSSPRDCGATGRSGTPRPSSSWAASSCSWSPSSAGRTSTAPAGGSTSEPRRSSPRRSPSSRSSSGSPSTSRSGRCRRRSAS